MIHNVDETGATRWDVTLENVSRAAHPLNLQVAQAICEQMSCTA